MGSFYHNVYFWLRDPDAVEDRKIFEASLTKFLNASKNYISKHVGVPASTDRPVIDRSYTYALVVNFKDAAAQDAYQEEEAHKIFISECKHLWTKVIVYDSEEI